MPLIFFSPIPLPSLIVTQFCYAAQNRTAPTKCQNETWFYSETAYQPYLQNICAHLSGSLANCGHPTKQQ